MSSWLVGGPVSLVVIYGVQAYATGNQLYKICVVSETTRRGRFLLGWELPHLQHELQTKKPNVNTSQIFKIRS